MSKQTDSVESEILKTLVDNEGYTTIFYVTKNRFYASAFTRLEKSGKIERIDDCKKGYPTMIFRIMEK